MPGWPLPDHPRHPATARTLDHAGTILYIAQPQADAVQAVANQPKILVVDDNAQNRALVRAALEDEDLTVVEAASGAEGVASVQAERPDCVLLDVRMPGMTGFEACAAMRALPGGGDLPIVFLTAQRDLETFDAAQRAGADDFLTKPVQPTELVMRVQTALRLRRMGEELREHYALVRKQRDDLKRLQLQKERLSAFVVHDLKNPINSMDLHAQLLLRNRALPDKAHNSAHRIRAEARSLLRMVLNLLDISRGEEGTLVPRHDSVEVPALIGALVEEFDARAARASVRLFHAGPAMAVQADPDLLRRVLENLVDNAIRHAPEDSQVEVCWSEVDEGLELRVADHGPGIAPELRERVFDRFVQLDSAPLVSRAGRGLGLAFCRLAIEAHGGRIWIGEHGPGTVFHVHLPR